MALNEDLIAVLQALSDPSLIVRDGIVVASNEAARVLLGRGIDGRDMRLAIRDPAALEQLMAPSGAGSELELFDLGGIERCWRMTITALTDGAKFVRLTDQSQVRAAEQMRVDFVVNASHELRTPLATVVGYAETLREQADELDPKTRERFTAIVHDEALRMQRLVGDLISLSRIEGERFSPPPERVSVHALLDDAHNNSRNTAGQRGVKLTIQSEKSLPEVAGDRAQLLQMVENLIGNAIRYGREGGVVSVSAGVHHGMVRLRVVDDGEGIAAEHLPRLTERFYRVDPSRSRAEGGTGLGLSIVKHVVERHRGRLSIESRVGEGTSVEVLLPPSNQLES